MPAVVRAKPGDSLDQIIKKFKKKVQQEDILTTIREKEFYKKPSVIRKERLADKRRHKRSY